MPPVIRTALALLLLGIITISVGILFHIDYATAGSPVAHLKSMKIIGTGFVCLLGSAWFSGYGFPLAKGWSILIVAATLGSAAVL